MMMVMFKTAMVVMVMTVVSCSVVRVRGCVSH